MTTLSSKLHDVTKQLQQLTVWRPNEHDPFIELYRWRNTAHEFIEEVYRSKRQEIDNLIEKHQRDFMKQIARQRLLLESLRQRSANIVNQSNGHLRIQSETSILTDLQKIERDISTKLGRGEIRVETKPIELNDLVTIQLKTYLANTSTSFYDEKTERTGSATNPRHVRPSTEENARAYQSWLRTKTPRKETIALERRAKQQVEDDRERRSKECQEKFDHWLRHKKESGAFRKKKTIDDQLTLNETRLVAEVAQS